MQRVPISLHEFARQMREQDVVFAERVAMFEATQGTMDDGALTVAVQANYICWFEYDFPDNLVSACYATGTGRPQRMGLCLHISPGRWLPKMPLVPPPQQRHTVKGAHASGYP